MGMSFKLSAQSSPRSAQSSHDLVRRVYLNNAKAYKHEWGIAGKLSSWPFDSCKLQCDTEHAVVAALRQSCKGHVKGDPGLNRTSAWPIYMYTGQDRGEACFFFDCFSTTPSRYKKKTFNLERRTVQ